MYEGRLESFSNGLITLFSGMLATDAMHVLEALNFVFSVILSTIPRYVSFLSYSPFFVPNYTVRLITCVKYFQRYT